MSTLAVTKALMAVFVPIGTAGAIIALACAVIAAVAIARGAAGLAGGAIGVWIVGALLSISASFAGQWTPFLVSAIALGAALVAGAVLRGVIRGVRAHRVTAARAAVTVGVQKPEAVEERVIAGRPAPRASTASSESGVRTEAIKLAA
ncbi:hypothetical protein [Microbacterium sp. YJN-G]|uniref:hypothetical protein n=1 Tax=Microbacterium sp. YJN-G TaxID=2763257 RepID=UPI0018783C9C|nr:hypothetical protein [Microbacterium sp. YJN-G]